MEQESSEDILLAERFAGGDQQAFERLYERYSMPLARYIMHFSITPEDAADIASQCFIVLEQHRQKFRSVFDIRAYLWLTARSRALTFLKRRGFHHKAVGELKFLADREEPAVFRFETETAVLMEIRSFIATMPEGMRKVVEMIYFEGMKPVDVARTLGVSWPTVRTQHRRAMALLRKRYPSKDLLLMLAYCSFFSCLLWEPGNTAIL